MAGLSGAQAGGADVIRDPGEGLAADDAQQGPVAVEVGPGDEHVGVQQGPAVGRGFPLPDIAPDRGDIDADLGAVAPVGGGEVEGLDLAASRADGFVEGAVAGVAGGGDAVQPVIGMAGTLGESVILVNDEGEQGDLRVRRQLDAVRREGPEVLGDPGIRSAPPLREGHHAVVAGGDISGIQDKNKGNYISLHGVFQIFICLIKPLLNEFQGILPMNDIGFVPCLWESIHINIPI